MMDTQRTSRQHGSAIVEFALVLPILLLLLGGMYGIGSAYAQYETLTKATRDGARLLSMASKDTIVTEGVVNAQKLVAKMAQESGMPDFDETYVAVSCLDYNTSTHVYSEADCVDGEEPDGVRVSTTGWTYILGNIIPIKYPHETSEIPLTASTSMRYMRP